MRQQKYIKYETSYCLNKDFHIKTYIWRKQTKREDKQQQQQQQKEQLLTKLVNIIITKNQK